jgi:hypothetical protein
MSLLFYSPSPFGGCCKSKVGCALRTIREAQLFVLNGAQSAPYGGANTFCDTLLWERGYSVCFVVTGICAQ